MPNLQGTSLVANPEWKFRKAKVDEETDALAT
jgi:hypothetical protein